MAENHIKTNSSGLQYQAKVVMSRRTPLFPSTIGALSHSAKFLAMKTMVRKTRKTTVRPGPGA